MATQTHTVNLTVPFIVWSVVFAALALATGSTAFWWVAALPWLFVLTFVFIMLAILGIAFLFGARIKVTTPGKGTRYVQRGRL